MQGRLSPPVDGKIQEFPRLSWEGEFACLRPLGLSHIEWVVTKDSFPNIVSYDAQHFNKHISGVCCDHLVDDRIVDREFVFDNLIPICEWCVLNSIQTINIPLLEESGLIKNDPKIIVAIFDEISKKFPRINFCFEIEDKADACLDFLKASSMGRRFWLIYDTGNITTIDNDHATWIEKCIPFIKNVHLKDRNRHTKQTVDPFTGGTPFDRIFRLLSFYRYSGIFTLQTARSKCGEEISTIEHHAALFKNLYNEKFI